MLHKSVHSFDRCPPITHDSASKTRDLVIKEIVKDQTKWLNIFDYRSISIVRDLRKRIPQLKNRSPHIPRLGLQKSP